MIRNTPTTIRGLTQAGTKITQACRNRLPALSSKMMPPHVSEEHASQPQPKRRSPKVLLIGGGVIALLALGTGGYIQSATNSADAVADSPNTTTKSSTSTSTPEPTGEAGPTNTSSEYLLINNAGHLDCSNLSEVPNFHDLDPLPNEYASDGFVKVRPNGPQLESPPDVICEFNSDRSGGLIQLHTSPSADTCSNSGDSYNKDMGWDGWYTNTSTSDAFSEIPGLEALTATVTTITFVPTSEEEEIGCVSISEIYPSNAQQDYLDQVAQIVYDNTPQA